MGLADMSIGAAGHLVTGSGFLPDHRIARAGEDVDDYLPM
jgi:hypothetical protein